MRRVQYNRPGDAVDRVISHCMKVCGGRPDARSSIGEGLWWDWHGTREGEQQRVLDAMPEAFRVVPGETQNVGVPTASGS